MPGISMLEREEENALRRPGGSALGMCRSASELQSLRVVIKEGGAVNDLRSWAGLPPVIFTM